MFFLICPRCWKDVVFVDEGYRTIFRCLACGFVGNEKDFGGKDDVEDV